MSNKKERKSNENNQETVKDESQCYICLTSRVNPCYADNCLHQFCTNCLMEWSKSSNECPVCRATFENLLINVKSDSEYETIPIQPIPPSGRQQLALENLLDMIISEITRNIPEATVDSPNQENTESNQTETQTPNGSKDRAERAVGENLVNRMTEINNQRETDLTVQSANESLRRWRRVSRDRRRRRRPKLILKSTEPLNNSSILSPPSPVHPDNQGIESSRSNQQSSSDTESETKETKKPSEKKVPPKDKDTK